MKKKTKIGKVNESCNYTDDIAPVYYNRIASVEIDFETAQRFGKYAGVQRLRRAQKDGKKRVLVVVGDNAVIV